MVTTPPVLPKTGGDPAGLALVGAVLVGGGAALGLGAYAFTRRRRFEG
ncbi:hypothetical protein [Phytohabitans suffuscus]|nr:hypothetical protein [Phytohabitans suffuscus]